MPSMKTCVYFSVDQASKSKSCFHAEFVGVVIVGMVKNAAQTGQERNNPGIDQRCVQADCSIEILKDEGYEQRLEYFK
jgi:hypothetical protein